MPIDSIVKQVHDELVKLHHVGFTTWITQVSELGDTYHLDVDNLTVEFKSECKKSVANRFIRTWTEEVHNTHSNPILRIYYNFKQDFGM